MHIAYLIPRIDRIGGAERQMILLASGMAQRGWRVSVVALSGMNGDSGEELSNQGVSFHSLEMKKGILDPRGWIRLRRWLMLQKPDLVHAHLPHAALLARWSRLFSPQRVLIDTIHSPATGGVLRRIAYRLSSGIPETVTAVSVSCSEPWVSAGLVDPRALKIVPNGIDLSYWTRNDGFREQSRLHSGLTDRFVWLAVGRLDPVKDHATLLRAFALLPPRAHLLVAGAGSLEPMLRQLSLNLGIADRVFFLGFQSDVLGWVRQADAFVLNSRWEGLPVSLMEACACELPAVITNTPGAREVLPDPLVAPVPVGVPDALAAAMIAMMLRSESARRNEGIRVRRSIASRFSLSGVLERYEEIYRGALSAKGST
jgi:glycosyltransferase involved in cell wall biosynthesis